MCELILKDRRVRRSNGTNGIPGAIFRKEPGHIVAGGVANYNLSGDGLPSTFAAGITNMTGISVRSRFGVLNAGVDPHIERGAIIKIRVADAVDGLGTGCLGP